MATKKNKGVNKALAITINLLPGEHRKQQKDLTWLTDRRVVWPTVFLILAIFVALFTYAYTLQELSSKEAELQSVRAAVERERPLLKKISELEKNQSIINTKINALKSIQISKKRWVVLFENISSVLPPNMWLLSVSQVSEFNLEMKGTTFDFSEVAEYMVKLEKQVSVQKVSLVSISTTKVDGDEAYSFTLKVELKKDLGEEG
ncbi:fimbrial assembly protein PilN [Fibrobacter succinogenes subsp. succinogenes S85]|jgi:type IV pilus assembly protein PilN|uniref:Fimbrial assembly family protein n=1 Tax=Fibrobacter succinogenes (strain ATCC 19169 / S85) TaxID=59374 RepID=C9RKD5_FIBSS|nr:PilN domain-containing protein [Fibrobacter succinogenes]ACX73863.1 Fimbrial assembly family protein [Fibrobacter succinogenes subsp. succinogenes S85]ADL26942.1 fimbrial assembly protein PilN [Fibrobacter succinogenes subsp. succinogenes S85]